MPVATIKNSSEINALFQNGTHLSNRNIALLILQHDSTQRGPEMTGRVAFIAGKRLGNAVIRNRSKRVMREAARKVDLPHDGYDIALIATRSTRSVPHETLLHSLQSLLNRAGLR